MRDEPMDAKKPRLEADAGSVKWITPWGECTAHLDSDGDLTLAASEVPCPVFTPNEWRRFCAAVNERINLNTERSNHDVSTR